MLFLKYYLFYYYFLYIMSGEAASIERCEKKLIKEKGLSLNEIVDVLTNYAPLSLAESWDNVGLLIEPFTKRDVRRIMLTNDLSVNVMNECMNKNTDMIISYHPPIFAPIKKFSLKTWTEKVIQCCLENRIAVFTPHTTWDSIPGGIGDWLTSAFDVATSEPLQSYYSYDPPDHSYSVVVMFEERNKNICQILDSFGVNKTYLDEHGIVNEYVGSCKKEILPQLYAFLKQQPDTSFEIYNRVPVPVRNTGIGRLCKFNNPITIKEAIERVKKHTGVKYCRVALAVGCKLDTLVSTAAVCPGSGAKVLANVKADLYVTGEMLHHDILAAVHNNSSVIMTNHSDSERGFLKVFADFLKRKLNNKVEVIVSSYDKDPVDLF
ncbi:cytosolic iron-sulfur assembly component 1 isoform X2 [Lycorma delicatula]|uniref:cytosolic iron-sulfur assembly component 1 isoform X2 n=1 Tax=Lycorma delicatula TaxID=130591 RepID=UPI003F5185E0